MQRYKRTFNVLLDRRKQECFPPVSFLYFFLKGKYRGGCCKTKRIKDLALSWNCGEEDGMHITIYENREKWILPIYNGAKL